MAIFPTDPLSWGVDTHAVPENHGVAGQTCRAGDPRPKLDITGKLGYIVCGHWSPRYVPTRTR